MAIDWTPLADCVTGLSREADIGASVVAPDGSAWAVQGDVQFPSASTAKIPIMIEVWRMIDRGEAALDDIHPVTRADKSNGSGVLRLMHAGLPVSLADLLYLMMAISDNTATNMLIRLAGIERINATMQELGMARSVLGRLMVGRLAIEGEQENLATPEDYTRVLDAIFGGRAASPEACTAMIATLERQQNARRIGRFVPTAPGWRWGSKTGTNTGVVNDAGFVIGPQGRMLVSVYVRGVEDMVEGERIIAMVTRAAMEACGLR
jgi:beta-lactamase class A